MAVGEWAAGMLVRGKYRIIAKVGQGGMASVYKAAHERFKEIRALKVINPELATDAGFVRRFEQEAIVTRKLQHPHAVRVDDIDEADDGRPFIVMEYIEGRSLKDVIEQEAPMAVARVCSIVEQAASALDAAHGLSLVHRDIKPGNIALIAAADGSGALREQVKILDFGIAKLKEDHRRGSQSDETRMTLTSTGMVIGTPAYMSPEQAKGLKGDALDGRSDLYSLGIVMYQMLTGQLPLEADSTIEQLMAHLNVPPRPIRSVRPDIPPAIAAAAMRCLEKNRELRPRNGQALIDELRSTNANSVPPPINLSATAVAEPAIARRAPREREPDPAPTTTATVMPRSVVVPPRPEPPVSEPPQVWATDQPAGTRSRLWLWAVLAVVVVAGFAVAFYRRPEHPKELTPLVESSPASTRSEPSTNSADTSGAVHPSTSGHKAASKTPSEAHERSVSPVPASAPRSSQASPNAAASSPGPNSTNPPAATQPSGQATPTPPTTVDSASVTPVKKITRVQVGSGVVAGLLISKVSPVYPPIARQARVQGSVVLKALIAKDGTIAKLELISGHPMLAPAAIDAVKQWRYRPYLLNGEPVEVETQIQVNFTLSGDPPPTGGSPAASPAGDSGGVYHIGAGVSAPAIISKVEPSFTEEARRAKKSGTCVLKLIVDTTGHPQNIQVVRPLGFGLDQKAIEAVQQWRFQPGLKDGKPVNVEIGLEVEFRLY